MTRLKNKNFTEDCESMEFLEKNAIYIVLIIVMLTWSGIFTYLFTLDKRLKELKKEVEEK